MEILNSHKLFIFIKIFMFTICFDSSNGILENLSDNIKPSRYDLRFDFTREDEKMAGDVTVKFTVSGENVTEIKLHAAEILELKIDHLRESSEETNMKNVSHNYSDGIIHIGQNLNKAFKQTEYELKISFTSLMAENSKGVFKVNYNHGGVNKFLFATNFESGLASYGFPCFDQNKFRATFNITIKYPSNYYIYHSMKEVKENNEVQVEGSQTRTLKFVEFSPDEKRKDVPTSELSFVICEIIPQRINTFEPALNLLTPTSEPTVLVDKASILFQYCQVYFGPYLYKLPELHIVVLEDLSVPVVNNYGMIIFKKDTLLIDCSLTLEDKIRVTEKITREFVKQWFRFEVTEKEQWLDETLRSHFISCMVTAAHGYGFDIGGAIGRIDMMETMRIDSKATAPTISDYINDPNNIEKVYLPMIKKKGELLIRMLFFASPGARTYNRSTDNFRRALMHYVRSRINGEPRVDMFDHMTGFLKNTLGESEKEKMASIETKMSSWFNSNGFPILTVTEQAGGSIKVKQTPNKMNRKNPINWVKLNAAPEIPVTEDGNNEDNDENEDSDAGKFVNNGADTETQSIRSQNSSVSNKLRHIPLTWYSNLEKKYELVLENSNVQVTTNTDSDNRSLRSFSENEPATSEGNSRGLTTILESEFEGEETEEAEEDDKGVEHDYRDTNSVNEAVKHIEDENIQKHNIEIKFGKKAWRPESKWILDEIVFEKVIIDTPDEKTLWYILNPDFADYLIVQQSKENWIRIIKFMNSENKYDNFGISQIDQMQVVRSVMYLSWAGIETYGTAFKVISSLNINTYYLPWLACFRDVMKLDVTLSKRSNLYKIFQERIRKQIEAVYTFAEKERLEVPEQFSALMFEFACVMNLPRAVNFSTKLFSELMTKKDKRGLQGNKSTVSLSLSDTERYWAEEEYTVYCTAVRNGSWNDVKSLYHDTPNSTRKMWILAGLACTTDMINRGVFRGMLKGGNLFNKVLILSRKPLTVTKEEVADLYKEVSTHPFRYRKSKDLLYHISTIKELCKTYPDIVEEQLPHFLNHYLITDKRLRRVMGKSFIQAVSGFINEDSLKTTIEVHGSEKYLWLAERLSNFEAELKKDENFEPNKWNKM